jgi:hypothetical protein
MSGATRGGFTWTDAALAAVGKYLLYYPAPIVFEIIALAERRCTGPMRRIDAGIVSGACYSVDVKYGGSIWREHFPTDVDGLYAARVANAERSGAE